MNAILALFEIGQFSVMSFFHCHAGLFHRNFKKFLLQRVSDCDVKREAPVVLLDRDVAGFLVGPFDLVLLFGDHSREPGPLAEWPIMSRTLLWRNNNDGP